MSPGSPQIGTDPDNYNPVSGLAAIAGVVCVIVSLAMFFL
jgi:hypothetical protein